MIDRRFDPRPEMSTPRRGKARESFFIGITFAKALEIHALAHLHPCTAMARAPRDSHVRLNLGEKRLRSPLTGTSRGDCPRRRIRYGPRAARRRAPAY